jgi:beta-glucosidase-like glycosyl hydrolase
MLSAPSASVSGRKGCRRRRATLVRNLDGTRYSRVPSDVPPSSGYAPEVPRLGLPALRLTEGSLGFTKPFDGRLGDTAMALPAGLALGVTFNPTLAREAGTLIGREVHQGVQSISQARRSSGRRYACGNNTLLNHVLKGAWGDKGWVMADWGAFHDWTYALKGTENPHTSSFRPKMGTSAKRWRHHRLARGNHSTADGLHPRCYTGADSILAEKPDKRYEA